MRAPTIGRSRRGMQRRLAEIGLARRVRLHIFANAFKLAAAHVLQVLPLGSLRRRLVQIHRNLVALPDFLASAARDGDAILQRHAFDRDERNHVGSAQAGMRARVLGQVDQFSGFADAANRRLGHIDGIADQGDDAAVVIGVHLAIEEIDAIHLHGFEDGIDASLVAPFREVGNTFDECGHNDQDKAKGGRRVSDRR